MIWPCSLELSNDLVCNEKQHRSKPSSLLTFYFYFDLVFFLRLDCDQYFFQSIYHSHFNDTNCLTFYGPPCITSTIGRLKSAFPGLTSMPTKKDVKERSSSSISITLTSSTTGSLVFEGPEITSTSRRRRRRLRLRRSIRSCDSEHSSRLGGMYSAHSGRNQATPLPTPPKDIFDFQDLSMVVKASKNGRYISLISTKRNRPILLHSEKTSPQVLSMFSLEIALHGNNDCKMHIFLLLGGDQFQGTDLKRKKGLSFILENQQRPTAFVKSGR